MKSIIQLPAIFLLIFIIVTLSFTFFNLLSVIVTNYTDLQTLNPAVLWIALPAAAFNILPGALILSLLIMLLNISLKPAPPFFAVLMLFIAACAAYTIALGTLGKAIPAATARQGEPSQYITAGRINSIGPLFLYPDKINTNTLTNTLVFNTEQNGYKFTFYNRLGSTVQDNKVNIVIENKKISAEIKNPYTRFLYEYDTFSGDILRAFGSLNDEFLLYAQKQDTIFYLSCFAFVFFIMASGMFTRITRWPLFNTLLFMSIITLYMFMYYFFKTQIYDEFLKYLKDKTLLDYVPMITMFALGVLFVLVDLIFIPRKFWKEGINSD